MPDIASLDLAALNKRVIGCRLCPRLVRYRETVAREKRRMYREWTYWGRPVPGFGDPRTELLIVGLAPGAHGSNRTGRMFTGDRSGDFLYPALYRAGFASQAEAKSRDDGLRLRNCYITAPVRCCPPQNTPQPEEFENCRPYFEAELRLLKNVRAVLALGQIGFERYLRTVKALEPAIEWPGRAQLQFAHGASFELPGQWPRLFACYHPSQQNTQTGKLTGKMMDKVLADIRKYLNK